MSLMKKFQAAVVAARLAEEDRRDEPGNIIPFEKPDTQETISEGRKRTLEACMDSTVFMLMQEIQEIGHWKTTSAVLEIEQEVHQVYQDILKGIKKLAGFRVAVEKMKTAGTKIH